MIRTERKHLPVQRGALAAALVITLAAAAAGAWMQQRMTVAQAAAQDAAFDVDRAMDLAGSEVPGEVESFYFFVLQRETPNETTELAKTLEQATADHEFVGVTGADAYWNRKVLMDAVSTARGRIGGLVIIYVGPAEHETELADHVRAAGAELRFVPYSAPMLSIEETI